MPATVSATEARVHFGELIRRVADHREAVYVERGGRPQVVLLAVSEYENLLSGASCDGWLARAREARDRVRAEMDQATLPSAEELIRQSREERDGQLDGLR